MLALLWAATLAASDGCSLDAYGVSLEAPPNQSVALRAELTASLCSLPPRLRDFPGGPLHFVLHDSPARPYGMGEWAGRAMFHLYPVVASNELRATWRLKRLSPDERERLWRRRALIHAVMQRWDDAMHWSSRRVWRRISGWRRPLEGELSFEDRPLNVFSGGYSRALGQQSASLELVTFAEEWLAPAESVQPEALAADDTVACQEPTRIRVLTDLMNEAGPLAPAARTSPCPALDGWLRPDQLEGIEVLLVAASGRRAESLFGHVLLRPMYRPDQDGLAPSLQTVAQIAAITPGPSGGLRHLIKGIFGGYRTTIFTLSMGDLSREVLEHDQRTMRRFRLNLTAREREAVVARIWELERRGYFDYRFFSNNCARVLLYLLEGALEESTELHVPGLFVVSPTSALDALAAATVRRFGLEAPLLQYVPQDLESSRERAERSEQRRVQVERALKLSPRARESIRALSPEQRTQGFRDLAERTRAWCGANPSSAECRAAFDWWALSARVERYRADEAQRALLELESKRLSLAPGEDTDAQVAERQQLFQQETQLAKHPMVLDRTEQARARREAASLRPMTAEEEAEAERQQHILTAFDSMLAMQGDLVEGPLASAGTDGSEWLSEDDAHRMTERAELTARAQPSSGMWRLKVGAGAFFIGTRAMPAVSVWSAGMAEDLGDQRVRGFQPGSEIHLLEGSLTLAARDGGAFILRAI